ncbi:DUF4173 domain-containing protein [Candidatus Parcubacteria bacterium]|jgi:hypothetical protein|nr:DUF4173 domain-containing protein [Candidatus Parcubacteria bacterium]
MEQTIQQTLKRHWRVTYVGFALLVAILYDVFFWGLQPGFGFVLFVAFYVLGFSVLSLLSDQIRHPKALLLLIPIFIFSLDILFYNNDFVRNWVMLFVALLMFLFSILLTLKNPGKHLFSFSEIPVLRSIGLPLTKWGHMFRDLFSTKKEKHSEIYKKIALALAIAVPILFVFGLLFVKADAVFAELVGNIFNFNFIIEEETVWRIVRTGLITLFLGGLFYTVIDPLYILKEKKFRVFKIDNTVVSIVLGLVNILFALFVFIQLNYLFGSHDFVVQNNINFAEYARSGFFQLAWVIALAAAMLIVFYRSAVHHGSHTLLKLLKILLVIQVGVIAMSALKRMNIYQDQFGYTVLRLYVEWFIYFCVIILTLSAVSISVDWKFRNFLYTSMVLGVGAMCIVSSINVDRVIARENVDRYINEGKELDMGYLVFHLSVDAIPEVKRAFDSGFEYKGTNNDLSYREGNFKNIYLGNKFRHLHKRISNKDYKNFSDIKQSWREFNFGIEKLKNL